MRAQMEVWGLVLTHTELGNKILPLSFLHVLKYYSKIPDVLSLCVCAYVHSVAIWNCLRNLVCVCSIWVPFHVCLLFVCFFLGIETISPKCHSAQGSPTLQNLPRLVVLFLYLSSLLLILNWTCLIYLYFRSRFLTSQV